MRLLACILIFAVAALAGAPAHGRKKCASLCPAAVVACVDTACAQTSGKAAKKCRRKRKASCQRSVMKACRADADSTRCTPPPTTSTTLASAAGPSSSTTASTTTTTSSTAPGESSTTTTTVPDGGPCPPPPSVPCVPPDAPPCPGARFLVGGGEGIVLGSGGLVAIVPRCGPVTAMLCREAGGATSIVAEWDVCEGLQQVRLGALLSADCRRLHAGITAIGLPEERCFRATPSVCGDRVIDPGNGEQCEGADGCSDGFACDSACRCQPLPPGS